MNESTSRFADLFRRRGGIERRLRMERPAPPEALVARLTQDLESAAEPRRARSSTRLGLAAAVSVVFLVFLAAFGGLGHAASSVSHIASTASHVVSPSHTASTTPALAAGRVTGPPITGISAAQFQYGFFSPICHDFGRGRHVTIYIPTFLVPLWLAVFPNDTAGVCPGTVATR